MGEMEEFSKQVSEALKLCQESKDEKAAELLLKLGYKFRLAPNIVRYQLTKKLPASGVKNENNCCSIYDSILLQNELRVLQEVFAPSSCFWRQHGYVEGQTNEYFSYAFSLKEPNGGGLMQTIGCRLIEQMSGKFPGLKDAEYIEWWAHCRPHESGHQLHFDSADEGKNKVLNPISSAVLYIQGEVGGPTLVTDQRISDRKLASKGWLCFPAVNRICMFDGTLLHMVVPGRQDTQFIETLKQEGIDRNERRVTVMISFWKELHIQDGPMQGAARRFPTGRDTHSWAEKLNSEPTSEATPKPVPVLPVAVDTVWLPLGDNTLTLPAYDECFQGL
mmetsp:Transcript_11221/g.13590  ORF Transcript_11221/g.13590 Transcript_11221/m.13590 type:complete len:333 (+) Transcript_11221:55-1053(+)